MPSRRPGPERTAARARAAVPVRVGTVEIGPGRPLALIAGPCVIEDGVRARSGRRASGIAERLGAR
jgi:3-deoxy-D-manno-octulosonic acid (KDO) 8-phosphate synthase